MQTQARPEMRAGTPAKQKLKMKIFSGAARCHMNQWLRRLIGLENDMENIIKALIGIVIIALLLSDALAAHTMMFPGESFSVICDNLLALVGIGLVLVAKKLTA